MEKTLPPDRNKDMGQAMEAAVTPPQLNPIELVQRLAVYAYTLFRCFPDLAMEPVMAGSGQGPEDLAMEVVLRYLDPADASVQWDDKRGAPTLERVLGYLKRVLWNDFVDLKRSAAYRTSEYLGHSGDGSADGAIPLPFDQFAAAIETPEATAIRREHREQLLASLTAEPELHQMLALQWTPDGYQALTNRQLAAHFRTTVSEIENRKKRLLHRLFAIRRRQQEAYLRVRRGVNV